MAIWVSASLLEFLWILFTILFWAGVIGLVVIAIRGIIQPCRKRNDLGSSSFLTDTPLDILKKRYARGEITRKEFLEVRQDVNG
jgi:putative membrane protein